MTLDLIVVAVLLIAFFLGFKVGFLTYALKIASIFTGLIMTLIIVTPIKNAVMDSSIGESEIQYYAEMIESSDYYVLGGDSLQELLVDIGIPSFFASILDSLIITDGNDIVYSVATAIAGIVMWLKVFFIVLIATTLLMFILKVFIKRIRKWTFIKFIDGVFGVAISFFLTFLCGYTMLSIIIFTTDAGMFSSFGSFMDNQLEQSIGVYRMFYEHNFIYNFINLIFK